MKMKNTDEKKKVALEMCNTVGLKYNINESNVADILMLFLCF